MISTIAITMPGPWAHHGMACAGITAASHSADSTQGGFSSSRIISLNPHVLIMPIKIFPHGSGPRISVRKLTSAIEWTCDLRNVDILSGSWNYVDPDEPRHPEVEEALERAYLS
jgi:hypothetical protein